MANKDFIDVSKMVKCFVTKLLVPTIAASTILSAGGCLTNPYMIKDEQGNYISPTTQKHRTFESPFLQSWLDEFRKPGKSVWTEEAAYYRVAHAKMEELSNAAGKGSPEWVNFTALDNLDFNNSDSVDILINKGLAGLSNEVGIKNTYIENLKKEIIPFVMRWGAYHPYDLALNDDFFVSVLKYGTGDVSHPRPGITTLSLTAYNEVFAFKRKDAIYSYSFNIDSLDPRVAKTEGEQLIKQMKHYNENYIGGGDPLKGFELLPVVHPFRDTSQFWNGNAPNKFNKNVFQGYYFFTPSELDSPNDTLNLKLEQLVNIVGSADTIVYNSIEKIVDVSALNKDSVYFIEAETPTFHFMRPDSTGKTNYKLSMSITDIETGNTVNANPLFINLPNGTGKPPEYIMNLRTENDKSFMPKRKYEREDTFFVRIPISGMYGLGVVNGDSVYSAAINLFIGPEEQLTKKGEVKTGPIEYFKWINDTTLIPNTNDSNTTRKSDSSKTSVELNQPRYKPIPGVDYFNMITHNYPSAYSLVKLIIPKDTKWGMNTIRAFITSFNPSDSTISLITEAKMRVKVE